MPGATRTPPEFWTVVLPPVIAAAVAVGTLLVRDVLVPLFTERRTRRSGQREILRNYLAPISDAAKKLLWRFHELFVNRGYRWTKTSTLPREFNQYKRDSTLYRLATLLGWVRAIAVELSALPRGSAGLDVSVMTSIDRFQHALADGTPTEHQRLRRLAAVWRLDLTPLSAAEFARLASRLEVKLYELAGPTVETSSDLRTIEEPLTSALISGLARFLCGELHTMPLRAEILKETLSQAIESLSYKEALVYREWQDAIGDAMLLEDDKSVRRFKILGFEPFLVILNSEKPWFVRFRQLLENVDFETKDLSDVRRAQLANIAKAVANLLFAIAKTGDRDLVDDSLPRAREVLEVLEQESL